MSIQVIDGSIGNEIASTSDGDKSMAVAVTQTALAQTTGWQETFGKILPWAIVALVVYLLVFRKREKHA